MVYPTRDPEVVEASWKYTGLAGGHRAYLGDEQASTLMALSFAAGYWWYKDREALGAMTEAWNADQAHREESGLPPKETDGLVIVEQMNDASRLD